LAVANAGDNVSIPGTDRESISWAPHQSMRIKTPGSSPETSIGFAYAEFSSATSPITAVLIQSSPGKPDFQATVPLIGQYCGRFVLLFNNIEGSAKPPVVLRTITEAAFGAARRKVTFPSCVISGDRTATAPPLPALLPCNLRYLLGGRRAGPDNSA
jgi:hypothetical protein